MAARPGWLAAGVVGSLSACGAPTDGALEALEQLLASEDSATRALTRWCRAHAPSGEPVVTARTIGGEPAAPAQVRSRLGIAAGEPLGYRHVQLVCGGRVLSEAHNWYLPVRLAPAMIAELAAGDRPFGAVIAPLGFRRERIDSRRGAAAGCPAGTILTNRALLRLPSGDPLAFVIECYQPALLAPAS